jgi:hypothetical protein
MRNPLSPKALLAIVLTSGLTDAHAQPAHPDIRTGAPGIRSDRVPEELLERWRSIVQVVFAEGAAGRPRHPTLRALWDEVAASGHEVYVELYDPQNVVPCVAGSFVVESVRPDGHIVAALRLNLKTIDRVHVEQGPADAFVPFQGLGREGRYAEVLGHELGHAVWTLESPERARRALELQSRQLELTRSLLRAKGPDRAEIQCRLSEADAQAEALEAPARTAEARVWEELVTGRRRETRVAVAGLYSPSRP